MRTEMEKRYQVPPEMLKAALAVFGDNDLMAAPTKARLEAAIRWLAENPVVPTETQLWEFRNSVDDRHMIGPQFWAALVVEWQRRMFLAPEPEVPEAIKDLWEQAPKGGTAQEAILEAYRRGVRDATNEQMADDIINFVDNKYGSPESK